MAFDYFISGWFHSRLNGTFAHVLYALSFPGGAEFVGVVLGLATLGLIWRRRWHALAGLILNVPCGLLLGEGIKLLVQRQRPYLIGSFVDWSGYSFPSSHTVGATLLYGTLVVTILPRLTDRRLKAFVLFMAAMVVSSVAFSRVALGAHYLTDVLAGMIFGLLWLGVCFRQMRAVRNRWFDENALPSLAVDDSADGRGRGVADGAAG